MAPFNEGTVEQATLEWLASLGWHVAHGSATAPDTPNAERADYGQVVLERRLRDTRATLNGSLPSDALDEAVRKLTRPEGASVAARNPAIHRMLVNGVETEYRNAEGRVRGDQLRVIDFENTDNNDWLAVNQFTVTENQNTRRPDIVLFVNGLPLRVIELKNPADEDATIRTAWNQLQTYKAELVRHERGASGLGREPGPPGHPHRRLGVVQALTHTWRPPAWRRPTDATSCRTAEALRSSILQTGGS